MPRSLDDGRILNVARCVSWLLFASIVANAERLHHVTHSTDCQVWANRKVLAMFPAALTTNPCPQSEVVLARKYWPHQSSGRAFLGNTQQPKLQGEKTNSQTDKESALAGGRVRGYRNACEVCLTIRAAIAEAQDVHEPISLEK